MRLGDWALKKSGRFAFPFLIVCGLGLLLRAIYPEDWKFHDTVHMLADALAVGAVVALTLEFFASRTLIHDAARELSERLVGETLPRPLQSEIAEIVHETAIVIDDVKIRYRIEVIPEAPTEVMVTVMRSYRATNYG